MGMIGLLVTVLVMVLGMGYLFFGAFNTPDGSVSVTNQNEVVSPETSLSRAESAIGSARDTKALLEKKVEEAIAEGEGTISVPSKPEEKPASPKKKETSLKSPAVREPDIVNRLVDFGFAHGNGARTIDTVVLHSSYNSLGGDEYSVSKVIDIWKGYDVAPHYMIDRKGVIYRLVKDEDIAYHAGASKMSDGRSNVNSFSIGIELLNNKEDSYTDAEYQSLNELLSWLRAEYPIKKVVGHDAIAPDRKTDPWNLDWKRVK